MPRVSALITVRNGERFVREAVTSLLRQEVDDLELIVVDDGSSDRTPAILAELAAADRRMKVVTQAPRGIPQAANRGLQECQGRFIARMDADDVAYPGRLARELAFLEAHPEVVCVGTYVDFLNEKGQRLTTIRSPLDDAEIQDKLMQGHCTIWHTSSMIRRDALDRVQGYDESFDSALDLDLWLRLGEVGKLANIPEALQGYRLHAGAVSETKRHRQRENCRRACENAARRRGVACRFVAHEMWRPGQDSASRHKFSLQYGWWAFNSGERRTASRYGLQAIRLRPWDQRGWQLLAMSLLKSPRAVGGPGQQEGNGP